MKQNKIIEYLIDNLDKVMTLTENFIYPYKGVDLRNLYPSDYSYNRSLQNLEKRKLIKKVSKNQFALTLQGKLEILKHQQSSKDLKINLKPKNWDGKWRILGFDIPEKDRKLRRQLREYLYILGFRSLQQSIWITPLKIDYQTLKELFQGKIEEKLVFIVTDQISEEEKIKKLFGLK